MYFIKKLFKRFYKFSGEYCSYCGNEKRIDEYRKIYSKKTGKLTAIVYTIWCSYYFHHDTDLVEREVKSK